VVAAKDTRNGNQNSMCKFITSPVDYTREVQLHDMLPEEPSPIPGICSPPVHSWARAHAPAYVIVAAWTSLGADDSFRGALLRFGSAPLLLWPS